jgi:hypothetical protein
MDRMGEHSPLIVNQVCTGCFLEGGRILNFDVRRNLLAKSLFVWLFYGMNYGMKVWRKHLDYISQKRIRMG